MCTLLTLLTFVISITQHLLFIYMCVCFIYFFNYTLYNHTHLHLLHTLNDCTFHSVPLESTHCCQCRYHWRVNFQKQFNILTPPLFTTVDAKSSLTFASLWHTQTRPCHPDIRGFTLSTLDIMSSGVDVSRSMWYVKVTC